MKIRNPNNSSPVELLRFHDDVYKLTRKNISYGNGQADDVGQNISGAWVDATTPGTANTNFTVTHNLNRIPLGFHVMSKNASTDVYVGSTPATTTEMTFKATGTSVAIRLFIF